MLGRWARDCFGAACDHHGEHPKAHAGRAYMGAEEAPTSLPSVVSSGLPCTRPWGCCALASPSLQCRYARPSWMNGPQRPPIMDGWQRPPRWTGGLPESAQVAAQPRAHPSSLCADSEEGEGGAGAAPSPTASAAAKKGRSVRDPSAAWEKRRPTPPPLRPPKPTPPPPTTVRCCCPCVGAAQHPLRTPPWKRRRERRACAAPRRLTAVRGPRRPRAQPVGATLRKEYAGCHARPRSDGTSVAHGEWTSTDAIVGTQAARVRVACNRWRRETVGRHPRPEVCLLCQVRLAPDFLRTPCLPIQPSLHLRLEHCPSFLYSGTPITYPCHGGGSEGYCVWITGGFHRYEWLGNNHPSMPARICEQSLPRGGQPRRPPPR